MGLFYSQVVMRLPVLPTRFAVMVFYRYGGEAKKQLTGLPFRIRASHGFDDLLEAGLITEDHAKKAIQIASQEKRPFLLFRDGPDLDNSLEDYNDFNRRNKRYMPANPSEARQAELTKREERLRAKALEEWMLVRGQDVL